jgi:hypothetical protein
MVIWSKGDRSNAILRGDGGAMTAERRSERSAQRPSGIIEQDIFRCATIVMF